MCQDRTERLIDRPREEATRTEMLRTRSTRPPPAVTPPRSRPKLFPRLHHPPRGCRVPLPEVRNRGYSHPSGGRVRALHAILRPRIPRNRPPNAQNRRENGFPGSNTAPWLRGHPVGQGLACADPDGLAARDRVPGSRVRRRSRRLDRRPRRGNARRRRATATGLGRWSTPPPAAPAAGRKTVGSEGARPPASLRRGCTECGPKE